jgi:hypothetical protein
VWAAAGTPTSVFAVPPGTLRSLANATVAPIAEQASVGVMDPDAQGAAGPALPSAGASTAGAATGA